MKAQSYRYLCLVTLVISICISLMACDDTTDLEEEGDLSGVNGGIVSGYEPPFINAGMNAGTNAGTNAGINEGGMIMAGMDGSQMLSGMMTGGRESNTNCEPGALGICFSERSQSICDLDGITYEEEPCPEDQYCLNGLCGNMRCIPSMRRCSPAIPEQILECNASGTDWEVSSLCAEGDACRNGVCVSGCEAASKLNTYIGCEYWTVDLDNYPDPFTNPMPNQVPHSVVLANPGTMPAQVSFETRSGATITVVDPVIPAGEVKAFSMPVLDVDHTSLTFNSIKVSSSMPVIAYQFNPLNNHNFFSNDASLLLPSNTLGTEYLIASWPTGPNTENIIPTGIIPQAGYFTVVATSAGETEVIVKVTSDTEAGPNIPALVAGETATFRLQQFQVLNLQAAAFTPATFLDLISAPISDLTGSLVSASQPVAVFGGHEEAVISSMNRGGDTCCADHLEEQLLPLNTWSNEALCVKAKPRGASTDKQNLTSKI